MPRVSSKRKAVGRSASRDFEDSLDERAERFGEEMERRGKAFGERIEARLARRAEKFDCGECGQGKSMWASPWTAGFALLFGLVGLVVAIFVLRFLNAHSSVSVFGVAASLLRENLEILVLAIVVGSVFKALSKLCRPAWLVFRPLEFALGGVVFFWFVASLVIRGGYFSGGGAMRVAAGTALDHLPEIFVFFAVVGFIGAALKFAFLRFRGWRADEVAEVRAASRASSPRRSGGYSGRRLYRSRSDRILGGVCGGIAEYLDVDPTIVRVFWVLASLLWGAGVLLYIILWVIVPLEPRG